MSSLKYFTILFLFFGISAKAQSISYVVPLGGNSWVNTPQHDATEEVTGDGWENWQHKEAVWDTYIKIAKAGTIQLSVLLDVPNGTSKLSFTIGTTKYKIDVSGKEERLYKIGKWNIKNPGYIRISATGIEKTGNIFANVKSFQIAGSAVDSNTAFVKNNEGNFFYWGRRGASVHINYDQPPATDSIEWFYNEITVPKGYDPAGSYFMADGFAEGYFGMQVNSTTERRFIFSVWSPFKTDNPKEIPEDKKIVLVKAGENVVAEEFGNEGSGGHSHLVYNWKAGETYKFLLRGKPVENNFTSYTAWFFDNENQKWMLVASFNRPATHTYLKRLHSFLESFIPETGDSTRKAFYHNQWVKLANGDWVPLNKMYLTADATAAKKYRKDYDGGVENGMFYMKNGGFFNETAELKKTYEILSLADKPKIDLQKLIEEISVAPH